MNSRKLLVSMAENWPAKVLSIALALILFTFHRMNTLTTRPLSVPLSVEVSSVLIPASPYLQNVRVTLRGEDEGVKSIAEGDIEAYIDLSRHETEGWYRAPVQIRKKGSALGVEPLEITVNPLEVSVQLDRRISKTLPLAVTVRGRVADGFDMISHAIIPTELVVVGPFASLEAITEIQTDPIDLEGRTGDFSVQVGVVNPNPLFVIRGNGMAEFSGVIRPAVPVRNIENIPIILAGLDPRFGTDMTDGRTGSIRLQLAADPGGSATRGSPPGGRQARLEAFHPPIDLLTVDCSGISAPGTYTLPVLVNLPQGFSLIRHEPEELELTIIFRHEELPGSQGTPEDTGTPLE